MENPKLIAITDQKDGAGKITTTVNLGVGLAMQGKKILLAGADPQGSLTVSPGIKQPDEPKSRFRFYCTTAALIDRMSMTAFAAGNPIMSVNNLSSFLQLIRIILRSAAGPAFQQRLGGGAEIDSHIKTSEAYASDVFA